MIAVIYASDYLGGIGLAGKIPWRCSSDTERFWATVADDPIVVGSSTWKGLAPIAKKHRHDNAKTYVLSRHFWEKPKDSNVRIVTVGDVVRINKASPDRLIWVCGGAQTYNAFFDENAVDFIIATTILDAYFTDTKLFKDLRSFDYRHIEGFTQILPPCLFRRYVDEPSYEIRVWANTKKLREKKIDAKKFLTACHYDYRFGDKE